MFDTDPRQMTKRRGAKKSRRKQQPFETDGYRFHDRANPQDEMSQSLRIAARVLAAGFPREEACRQSGLPIQRVEWLLRGKVKIERTADDIAEHEKHRQRRRDAEFAAVAAERRRDFERRFNGGDPVLLKAMNEWQEP